jgi:hypothetical protein
MAPSSNGGLAKVLSLPDIKTTKSQLLGKEIGTQFDWGQRLFAYYGDGDVFLP